MIKTRRRADAQTRSVRVMALRAAIVLSLLPVCASARLRAQQQQASSLQVVDRIVAIVGDRPILLSEVDEKINDARSTGLQVPTDSTQLMALRRTVLNGMIEEEVVYQKARADTAISVTDAEVQSATEDQYRQVRGQFRTEAEFRTAIQGAGWGTPEEYRRYLADQNRRTAYGRRYIDRQRQEGKMRSGTVSDAEMRAFFNDAKARGDIPRMPPTVQFKQIVVSPRASAAARAAALLRAESVRTQIEHGADFATLARRFSDDPTTKDNGGDLGFFRRGQMVRAFEDAAFNIRPGLVSPIVSTEYGFHLILVERVLPGQVKARHILFAPAITPVEAAAARATADSVTALLRAGGNVDSLARVYGDSAEPRTVGPTPSDSLPAAYIQAFTGAQPGQVLGPLPLNPEAPDRTRYLVAVVMEIKPEHDPVFEDLREQVRSRLLEQKGIRNLVEDLKKQIYVDIRL